MVTKKNLKPKPIRTQIQKYNRSKLIDKSRYNGTQPMIISDSPHNVTQTKKNLKPKPTRIQTQKYKRSKLIDRSRYNDTQPMMISDSPQNDTQPMNISDSSPFLSNRKRKIPYQDQDVKFKRRKIKRDHQINVIQNANEVFKEHPEFIKEFMSRPQVKKKSNIITLFVTTHGMDLPDRELNVKDNILLLSFPGMSGTCGLYIEQHDIKDEEKERLPFYSINQLVKLINTEIDNYAIMTNFLNDLQKYLRNKYLDYAKLTNKQALNDYLERKKENKTKGLPDVIPLLQEEINLRNAGIIADHNIGMEFIIPKYDHAYIIKDINITRIVSNLGVKRDVELGFTADMANIHIINHLEHTSYEDGSFDVQKVNKYYTLEDIYKKYKLKKKEKVSDTIKFESYKIVSILLSDLYDMFETVFENLELNIIDNSCRYTGVGDKDNLFKEYFTVIAERNQGDNLIKTRLQKNIGGKK